MRNLKELPAAFIAECLYLRPDGTLIWKERPQNHFPALWLWERTNTKYAGKEAGTVSVSGYRHVSITRDGVRHMARAHRIVWLLTHGEWPTEQIDHINGNRLDNSPENLRQVSSLQNSVNQHGASRNNKLGVLGVHAERKSGKFVAQIRRGGEKVCLGRFGTAEEAGEVYQAAKSEVMSEVGL